MTKNGFHFFVDQIHPQGKKVEEKNEYKKKTEEMIRRIIKERPKSQKTQLHLSCIVIWGWRSEKKKQREKKN